MATRLSAELGRHWQEILDVNVPGGIRRLFRSTPAPPPPGCTGTYYWSILFFQPWETNFYVPRNPFQCLKDSLFVCDIPLKRKSDFLFNCLSHTGVQLVELAPLQAKKSTPGKILNSYWRSSKEKKVFNLKLNFKSSQTLKALSITISSKTVFIP